MPYRILIISQYFIPDITALSFRMKDMYEAFKQLKFQVTVVTTYPHKSKVDYDYSKEENIFRLRVKSINKKGFFTYIHNYFGFMFKAIMLCLFRFRRKDFDYVIITSPPLFIGISGIVLAKYFKAKLLVDIRDIWPDSAVAAGMIKKESLLYKFSSIFEKFLYKQASEIICVSSPMKKYLEQFTEPEKISVFYNGVSDDDLNILSGFNQCAVPRKDTFNIMYAGNLGILQDVDTLLFALETLRKKGYDNIQVTLIGDGIEQLRLKKICATLKLNGKVQFLQSMKREEALQHLTNADCLFLHLAQNATLAKTIPSKLFDYLLVNKPIVYGIQGEGKKILDELNCGISFIQQNVTSLVNAIIHLYQNLEIYTKNSQDNCKFVQKNFNRKKQFIQLGRHLNL